MENTRPRPKQTMSEICRNLQFTTRQGVNERADFNYMYFSLKPFRNTLIKKHKFDFDSFFAKEIAEENGQKEYQEPKGKRKPLPYSVIVLIYKNLG